MIRKSVLLAVAALCVSSLGYSESMRTRLTVENKFPDLGQAEVGADGGYWDYEFSEELALTPFVRYGLAENLTVFATAPYRQLEPEYGEKVDGMGDATVGFDLVAWQDIFDYPYIIPHVEIGLPTGDEDEGLGAGNATVTGGISAGTIVEDVWHFIADVGYVIDDSDDKGVEDNNHGYIAGSLVLDLSKEFALLGEIKMTDEKSNNSEDSDYPVIFDGGFSYKASKDLMVNWYVGGSGNSDLNSFTVLKMAYSF